jgi:hypothetical protein
MIAAIIKFIQIKYKPLCNYSEDNLPYRFTPKGVLKSFHNKPKVGYFVAPTIQKLIVL